MLLVLILIHYGYGLIPFRHKGVECIQTGKTHYHEGSELGHQEVLYFLLLLDYQLQLSEQLLCLHNN